MIRPYLRNSDISRKKAKHKVLGNLLKAGFRKISAARLIVIAAVIQAALFNWAAAEVLYDVYGKKFPVLELQQVDGSNVEVKINNRTEKILIQKEALPAHIAEFYLLGDGKKLPLPELFELTAHAAEKKDYKTAGIGLKAISLADGDFYEPEIKFDGFLSSIFSKITEDDLSAVFIPTLKQANKSYSAHVLQKLLEIAIVKKLDADIQKFAVELNAILKQDDKQLQRFETAFDQLIKKSVDVGNLTKAFALLRTSTVIFKDFVKQTTKYVSLNSKLELLAKLDDSTPLDSIKSLMGAISDDYSNLSEIIDGYINERLTELASAKQKSGETIKALELLLEIKFNKRTETTHQELKSALQRLSETEDDLLVSNEQLRGKLFQYAQKDADISALIINKCLKVLAAKINQNDLFNAELIYNGLVTANLQIINDPQIVAKLDDLRIIFIRKYLDINDHKHANEKLSEVSKSSADFSSKLEMLLIKLRLSGKIFYFLIAALILLVAAAGYYYSRLRNKKKASPDYTIDYETDSEGFRRTYEKKTFVNPVVRKTNPLVQEYLACAAAIGVKPGATEKQIKVAFRNLAKQLHPDIAGAETNEDPTEFLELQKKYNRLLELERQYSFSTQDFLKES